MRVPHPSPGHAPRWDRPSSDGHRPSSDGHKPTGLWGWGEVRSRHAGAKEVKERERGFFADGIRAKPCAGGSLCFRGSPWGCAQSEVSTESYGWAGAQLALPAGHSIPPARSGWRTYQ